VKTVEALPRRDRISFWLLPPQGRVTLALFVESREFIVCFHS
jgi:hypothetical protein